MKKLYLAAIIAICSVHLASAEGPSFNGLEKVMDRDTYERAGLKRLTPEERQVLDTFVREYVGAKQRDAATVAASEAVDRAVKERKVQAPEVIESRMVGIFKGYGPRTFFHLENGQTWKPTNDEVAMFSPVDNANVVIYRDTFGYKMFIGGATIVRVKRIQ